MTSAHRLSDGLSAGDMEAILEVTRALAAPFDLLTMLAEVTRAARQVLRAERASVWLHDPARAQLVLSVAADVSDVRIDLGVGLVGACARDRRVVNVPDCYADPRFDPGVDRRTGFRTRCSLAVPLVDHAGALVGVMQVLNKAGGPFDAADERLGMALAAQCAVALQRARMMAELLEGARLREELAVARELQMASLPAAMPRLDGYDAFGLVRPAAETGGDTFDLWPTGQGLLVVLADASGHGLGPAVSVMQMQAMLRMALRVGTSLETTFRELNDQLADTLPADRFVTAFIGLLDASTHRLRFHSAGQAPILHWRAGVAEWASHRPTSFPLGALPLPDLSAASLLEMQPGDVLVLLSDGVFEARDAAGEAFGEARVRALVQAHAGSAAMAQLAEALLQALQAFTNGVPQEDDVTVVLLRRDTPPPDWRLERRFERTLGALGEIASWTRAAFDRAGLDAALRGRVDVVIEELFTNMLKYSPGGTSVSICLAGWSDAVEGVLVDAGVDAFDPTQAPAADTALPIEQRRAGGLGLHLVRRLVDALHYDYRAAQRTSRITFRMLRPRGADGVATETRAAC